VGEERRRDVAEKAVSGQVDDRDVALGAGGGQGERPAPATIGPTMPRDIQIRGDTIRLGQLLKLAGIADSGGEARALVERGVVRVNGEVETRRGRQLHPGDVIAAGGEEIRVA
jgi:ribosome-associated protein